MRDEQRQIAHRLREWLEIKRWTKAEFAFRMHIRPQHVNKYLEGALDPRNLISDLFKEGCDIDWLLTGNGAGGTAVHESTSSGTFGKVQYPVVSHIWAGKGGTKTAYEFDSKVTLDGPSGTKFKGSLYFEVKGDSMEPRWEEGDFVLVNPNLRPKNGDYGVTCWDGEDGALKKIFYQKDRVVLQSLNSKHAAITVEKDQIWFIGKVVSTLHK